MALFMGVEEVLGFKKRKWAVTEERENLKRRRNEPPGVNITNLSDCVLVYMFSFLDSTSLYQLGQTCSRFYGLVRDESLWINVDARSLPNSMHKATYCWANVHRRTRRILLAGSKRSEVILSLNKLIYSNSLLSLTVLALENQHIKYCKLKDFPSTIQELSFRKSFIAHHCNFFRFSHDTMSNLKTLILDHCQWLLAGCFVSICKYPKLEILSLYMCKKLGDDDMTSIGLAGHYGFPSIKVVDLRFTDIGDAFIRTFYKSSTLQVIYLQSFVTTYYAERLKRKQDICNGEKRNDPCYISDDDDDMSTESIKSKYKSLTVYKYSTESVNNSTVSYLKSLKPTDYVENPKSFLYVYPYPECVCDNAIKKSQLYVKKHSKPSAYDYAEDDDFYTNYRNHQGMTFMLPNEAASSNQVEFDSCLAPAWCQEQSAPDLCRHKWLFMREPRNDHEIEMLEHTDKHFKARTALRYRNAEQCGEIACGCSRNAIPNQQVIVVPQNHQGRQSPVLSDSTAGEPKKYLQEESIFDVIGQIAVCMERIKFSIKPDSEVAAIVSLILCATHTHSLLNEYINDSTFVCHLRVFISEFVRHVKQKIDYVLRYHFKCFENLFSHLQNCERVTARKRLLELFFQNLMHSEITINEDRFNVAGPSSRVDDAYTGGSRRRSKNNSNSNRDGPQAIEHIFDTLARFVLRRNILDNFRNNDEQVVIELIPQDNNDEIIVRMMRPQPNYNTYLQELSLRGYRGIDNHSLDDLLGLNLTLLDVTGTKVTLRGLQHFLLYNPNCRIIHKDACVCRPNLHF